MHLSLSIAPLVKYFAKGMDTCRPGPVPTATCLVHAIKDPLGCYEVVRYDGDYEAMMREVMSVYRPVHPKGSV